VPVKSDPASWRDPRQRLGLAGEEAAGRFLEERGWQVLEHRFRMGRLEIDLVVRKGSLVAFVEVKTRLGTRFGSPLEAVGRGKRREITRVALAWTDRHGGTGDTYRFDVIGVTLSGGQPKIEHVEGAFWPGWR
jgi:putative endonuclease